MRLTFSTTPPPHSPAEGSLVVVSDMAWSRPPDGNGRAVALRDAVVAVLASHDLYREAMDALDAWAEAAGIDEAMTVDGISFWQSRRLGMWWTVHDWLLWAHVIDELRGAVPCEAIDVTAIDEPALLAAARVVAARDGIALLEPDLPAATTSSAELPPVSPPASADPAPIGQGSLPIVHPLARWLRARRQAWQRRSRRRALDATLARARSRRPRTVVIYHQHVNVEVRSRRARRWMDPYLEPVVDALRSSGLGVLRVVRDLAADDDAARRAQPDTIPGPAIGPRFRRPEDRAAAAAAAGAAAARIRATTARLEAAGGDFGAAAREFLARDVEAILPARLETRLRIGRMLREVDAGALVLAFEYGRPDWVGAARDVGIPVVAVQHGAITAVHPGYMLSARSEATPIADRTLVYGRWERDLLLDRSIYRDHEVAISGAPRLDVVSEVTEAERLEARRELGTRDDERLVVHSTSWGPQIQRFYTPAALDAILDRPLPRVHLVIKLHPSEHPGQAEEYRRLIDALALARGFTPPRVTIVGRVDLYRLLQAADAHLGLFSTVLTDAVAAGAPNLVITAFATRDLLGYVPAGVGLPVRDGGDLLRALDRLQAGNGPTAEARAAFMADHFEPGAAGPRVAAVVRPLLEAMSTTDPVPPRTHR